MSQGDGRGTDPAVRRAAVFGSPIAHSLSPALHAAAYAGLGLTGWRYGRREVTEPELADVLGELGPEWIGLSLTMPLKQAILPLLDAISPLAEQVGAVNTVSFDRSSGELVRRGDNTDVAGVVAALRGAGVERATSAVVLGGGATAASALAALRELGERSPTLVARSQGRSEATLRAAERLGVRPMLWPMDDVSDVLPGADVVISTLPPGAADRLMRPGQAGPGVLLDVVYAPWPTALAESWATGGGPVVSGLEMLVHQAAEQVRLWTGRVPDIAAMRAAGLAEWAADRKPT